MINEYISVLFLVRDVAHREHLRTTSFAQHMALGSFYESIIELADKLTEAYQGRNGIIDDIPILAEDNKSGTPATRLRKYLKYVEDNRYDAIEKSDTSLQNIIDEIVGEFLSTLYKLDNLK